ncbi:MAG: lysine biosynthesis protein LysW [Thaumarchaeota archaeon]|nr:lysine biosynthesis protein LysW [Nitrososphaerota archaeon]
MNCLECDSALSIPADAIQGEVVSCKDCGASYELTKDDGTGLPSIRPAALEEEDWGE